jgi:hypothetical protein
MEAIWDADDSIDTGMARSLLLDRSSENAWWPTRESMFELLAGGEEKGASRQMTRILTYNLC